MSACWNLSCLCVDSTDYLDSWGAPFTKKSCWKLKVYPRKLKCQDDPHCLILPPLRLPTDELCHRLIFCCPAGFQGTAAASQSLRAGSKPERYQLYSWQQNQTSHPLVGPGGNPAAAQQTEGQRLPYCLKHGVHGEICHFNANKIKRPEVFKFNLL